MRLIIAAAVLAVSSSVATAAKHDKDVRIVCPKDCATYFQSATPESYDLDDIYRACFKGAKMPVRLNAECEKAVKSQE